MSEGTHSQYSSDSENNNPMTEDIEMMDDSLNVVVETQIFTQHLPIIGKISMFFYIPDSENQIELINLIEKNGGKVLDQHECFTYQLKPENAKPDFSYFYKGPIYSSKWINESIEEGKCLSKDDYFICINIDEKAKKLNIGKKKKYTIIEGIKLFETVSNVKNLQINSSQFWTKVHNQGILPERTADSLKTFWKKMQFKTLEQFLIESIHENSDFCLSFKKIPNPDFIPRFKAQYESEFMKMQAFKNLNEDMEVITEKEKELERQFMLTGHIGRQQVQAPIAHQSEVKPTQEKVKVPVQEKIIQQVETSEQDIIKQISVQKEEQKQILQPYAFKKINKLPEVTYEVEELSHFTQQTRPESSVENLLETQLGKRMKRFLPTNFDLVDYDKELLKKQLDLEKVTITLARNSEKEKQYEVDIYFARSVERSPNDEGIFNRLQLELLQISQDYGVPQEDVHNTFIEVSCSKSKLLEVLKGQSFTKWNELEDLALERGTEAAEYTYLLKVKGADEIVRRKKFLGL